MTKVWRIVQRRYVGTAFSGLGAARFGGRWNPVGVPVVYCSTSVSLAALELYVHLDSNIPTRGLVLTSAEIPEGLAMKRIEIDALPRHWRRHPPPRTLARLGAEWVTSGESAILVVPSAVVIEDRNILLNPMHPEFSSIRLQVGETFSWDRRLILRAVR